MKKSILIIFVVIAFVAITAPAFAGGGATISALTQIGAVTFQPSTNVVLQTMSFNGTDPTNPNTYCVVSVHTSALKQTSGKEYGATSGSSVIKAKAMDTIGAIVPCTASTTLPGSSTDWQ